MSTTLELDPSVGEGSVKSTEIKRPKSKPWQRQRGEPVASFRLFLVYLELGESRSLRRVSELDGSPCLRIIERKSRRWNWKARAEATDARLARKAARSLLRRLYRERIEQFRARLLMTRAVSRATLEAAKKINASMDYGDLRLINRNLNAMKKALIVSGLATFQFDRLQLEVEGMVRGRSPKF